MKNIGTKEAEDQDGEIISILALSEGTPNLNLCIKDLKNLLINPRKRGTAPGQHNSPFEFKLIKFLASNPMLFLDYINGYVEFRKEDIQLTNPTIANLVSAIDNQIEKRIFDDIGPVEDLRNVLTIYIKEQYQKWHYSILPAALSELEMLYTVNDIKSFNRSLRQILTEMKIKHPIMFSCLQDNESLLVKAAHLLELSKDLIAVGSYSNIGDESFCMLSLSKYINLTENEEVVSDAFPRLFHELLLLASLNRKVELETVIRKVILDVKSYRQAVVDECIQQEQNSYKEKLNKVVSIISNVVSMEINDDIDDHFGCMASIITILSVTEKSISNNGNAKIKELSPVHEKILVLNQTGKETELGLYIRKLLVCAKTPFSFKG